LSIAAYIILGLLITFLAYFLVSWGLDSLYFWISKEQVSFVKNVQVTASLALIGFLACFLLMIILSSLSIYIFTILVCAASFGLYYGTLKFLWKFTNFDAIVISTTLAIILNPAWLRLLGVI